MGACGVLLFWIVLLGVARVQHKGVSLGTLQTTNFRSTAKQAVQSGTDLANSAFDSAQENFRKVQHEAMAIAEQVKQEAKAQLEDSQLKVDEERKDPLLPYWEQDSIDRPGVIVLGMHRSGTSMLSGLLVTGLGYHTGGPLIGPAFDNAKGFFERVDIVLQNDAIMSKQHVDWSQGVTKFDPDKASQQIKDGEIKMDRGTKGIDFLNDAGNQPWLQKDPRMCITLKVWIPLLSSPNPPAVLFTYRHPLEVANSLHVRNNGFPLERGLRLWIAYNMKAVQNMQGLCIVYSSNTQVLADPLNEVQRISDQLTSKCNVPRPPKALTQRDVDVFVDPNLQHKASDIKDTPEDRILERHGDCIVPVYETEKEIGSQPHKRELDLYKKAMKIYCDFQSGDAYNENYSWPDLS